MNKIPFLLLGDGPAEPTGLGRIARDLAGQLTTSTIPLDLVQVGGTVPPVWTGWKHVPLDRQDDWGARNVEQIYRSIWGQQPGVLFAVWDPSRLYPYLGVDLPVQRWAYCAIDAANVQGSIGGPAQEAVAKFDRVLAYGPYGASVLGKAIGGSGWTTPWLPHGVSFDAFMPQRDSTLAGWADEQLGPHALGQIIIGCVMANQPRKDFGLLFHTLSILRERGWPVYLWLHTDELVKAWSVQQLVEDFGLVKKVTVTGIDMARPYTDYEMAALYQRCAVTVLPSLGEGFGYPIVESLASGVPCVHSDCAGGSLLVPRAEWKVPVRDQRLEGVYALVRPVMHAEDWANAVERTLRWREEITKQEGSARMIAAYCRGSVAHLDWKQIWPLWERWIAQGLGGRA